MVSLVERAGEAVLQRQQAKNGASLADSLFKFDGFKKEFAGSALPGVMLSEQDTRAVIRFLERDKRALVIEGEVCSSSMAAHSALF